MAYEPTKVTCSGTKYYLFEGVERLPVEAEWRGPLARARYAFTRDTVECSVRSLLKRKEWQAPLAEFLGVLTRRRQYGKNSYLYMVVLKHGEQSAQDVVLYQSLSRDGLRDRQEECARVLGLPALVKTDEGYTERAAGELDKSVRERVAEGSLKVEFDAAAGPPGSRLTVRIDGDALRLRARSSAAETVAVALALAFGILAGLGGRFGVPLVGRIPGWIPVLCTAAGAFGFGWLLLITEELLVSPEEVRGRYASPWGSFAEHTMPAAEVEEVYVGSAPDGGGGNRVQVVGDSGVITYGSSLTKAERHWVRDCIVAVISK